MAGLQHSGHVNHESSGTGILGAHQPGAPVCQQGNKELAKQLIEEIHVQQSQEEGNQGEARQGNKVLGVSGVFLAEVPVLCSAAAFHVLTH